MRKYIALVLTLVCVLALVGCEKNDTYKIREPLNNSLYAVPTRCISRHLRLIQVISAQNSRYSSAFLSFS